MKPFFLLKYLFVYSVTKNVLSLKSKISEIRTELLLALNYSQNTRTFPLPLL
jgi:hypothetical protein